MRIGIIAPFETSSLIDLIGSQANELPLGYAGAPMIGVLARALIQRGHQVSIFTTDNTLLPAQLEPVVFKNEHLTIYYCPARPRSFTPQDGMNGRMTDFYLFERQGLKKSLLMDQPEIIHAHWAYEFSWAAMDSKIPYVVTFHDSPLRVLRYMPNLYRLGRYFMARKTIKTAKLVTTVSPYMQDQLLRWSGRKVELVPNGLEEDWFSIATTPDSRELLRPKIGMISNGWIRLKNTKQALEAFALIRKKLPQAELHLFGIDYGPNELAEQWCRKNGIAEGLYFHGKIPYTELKKHFLKLTLLIHPSLEESFGMTVVEAMALALPVVGGDKSGAVPWLLENGEAGILTNVKDSKKIAEEVLKLLNDSQRYLKLAFSAQTSARKRFLVNSVAEQYESYYQRALKNAEE